MSSKLIGLDSGLQRLIDEGYEVEVRQQHLLIHSVPYVSSERVVKRGTMVCKFIENAGTVLPPAPPEDSHQVWWTGDYPCFATGDPISQISNENGCQEIFKGCTIQFRFSNKPDGATGFPDHYSKVVHYVTLLGDQAKALDPCADARTGRLVVSGDTQSPFRYAETASVRAEIVVTSARLAIGRVAIVGIGGTGSYVLDQVAKTPVSEIHIFDGDIFLQHNAFRSPGAATEDEIAKRMPKTAYFKRKYDPMHRGIVEHPYDIDDTNVGALVGSDFVFVCVDRGLARAVICRYLQSQGIPFIDVGMNLQTTPEGMALVGTCRYTLVTPNCGDHLSQYIPMDDGEEDVLYRQNIQIADMNALNAQLAVMKWKQHLGFYKDDFLAHNGTFSVNLMALSRDVLEADHQ